jgi:hypothetical protein
MGAEKISKTGRRTRGAAIGKEKREAATGKNKKEVKKENVKQR